MQKKKQSRASRLYLFLEATGLRKLQLDAKQNVKCCRFDISLLINLKFTELSAH